MRAKMGGRDGDDADGPAAAVFESAGSCGVPVLVQAVPVRGRAVVTMMVPQPATEQEKGKS
jgi:hypothetical protein